MRVFEDVVALSLGGGFEGLTFLTKASQRRR